MKVFKKIISIVLVFSMCVSIMNVTAFGATDNNVVGETGIVCEKEGYTIEFSIISQWNEGYSGKIRISNTGNTNIENWYLACDFNVIIESIWNANIYYISDNLLVVKNAGWNQDIPVGGYVECGFIGKGALNELPTGFELVEKRGEANKLSYSVEYELNSDWGSGYNGTITITNNSEFVLEDWELEFNFNRQISNIWNGIITENDGSKYLVKNAGYNSNILPGDKISFGINGYGGNIEDEPSEIYLYIYGPEIIEYVELSDGRIDKNYYENAILTELYFRGIDTDNIKLSDDFDGDGLTLIEEYDLDTNPFLSDSDTDGLSDYEEVNKYNTNPIKWDTDDDTMGDGTEVSAGLNPLSSDSDGDGIVDGNETTIQLVNVFKEEIDTFPTIKFVGCGDYSKEIYATKIEHDATILDIDCIVGTPFDFIHEDDLYFEESELTFTISDEILAKYSLDDLAIAYYNEEDNSLEVLDTIIDTKHKTITSRVEHYSIYMVISVSEYMYNIDWNNTSEIIESGKSDIVFVIDTTGSMGSEINNVKNNIEKFVATLNANSVDVRLGLVEYRDIYVDGLNSTKNYGWYTDASVFKVRLSSLIASGGGDAPESVVDAIKVAREMEYRTGVNKYIIVITDAGWKNGTSIDINATLYDEIVKLQSENINTSVITTQEYYDDYAELIDSTGGVSGNIRDDFSKETAKIIEKVSDTTNDKYWIRLSNGSIVALDKDPSLGDENVDTDGDGIPDIIELNTKSDSREFTTVKGKYESVRTWTFYSNPVKPDTDGDGFTDMEDLSPTKYDTTIVESTDEYIRFNTGREWKIITCTAYDFYDNLYSFIDGNSDNTIDWEEFQVITHNYYFNSNEGYNLEELTVIGLLNQEGAKLYMHYESAETRETVFQKLTGRASKYYKHTGILGWSKWEEVTAGTEKGFFKSIVISEADLNFSSKIEYENDIYEAIDGTIVLGAVIISAVLIAKATPIIVANIEGLVYYIQNFGIYKGLEMYTNLGISNLPNGVISVLQADLADGDSIVDDLSYIVVADLADGDTIADDVIYYVKTDAADGDTVLDDVVLGTYNNLRKIYKGTGIECHHLIEKRFLNALKPYAPTLKEGDFLSIPLNPQAHRVFTNAWRKMLPYGTEHQLPEIINASQKIYEEYPVMLNAVNSWLRTIGVTK